MKTIIMVEGFTDVILLWQGGIRFSVAAMGTAFSEKHTNIIQKSGAVQVITMYDPDEAGNKAASHTVISLSGKLTSKVAVLPEGKDPDEIILTEGVDGITKLCDKALEPIVFLSKSIENSFEFIHKEPSSIKQEKLLSQLSVQLGVSETAVKSDYRNKYIKEKVKIDEEIDAEIYAGKTEFELWEGSKIKINPEKWQMWHHYNRWDKATQTLIEEKDLIQCTHILIPKYKVQQDNEIIYTIECRRPKTKPILIMVPETVCGESTKMQNCIIKNSIAIQVGRMRNTLHNYFIAQSEVVKMAYVGVNYSTDGIFVCGYDYIVKDGKYYPAKNNIVEVGTDIYFIAGHQKKNSNEHELSSSYLKTTPETNGKIKEFIKHADKLFKTKEKSRIAMAFLASSMLREKLVNKFAEVPSLNFWGQAPSVGKTTLLDALSVITNIKKHKAKITEHQLYTLQEQRMNGLIFIDDMRPVEYYIGFLKDAASNSFRPRRDLDGKVNNPQIRNSVFMTTNHF